MAEGLNEREDAKRFRAIRDALPEIDDGSLSESPFVLTTREGPNGFCTYAATTRAEFDEVMAEILERADLRTGGNTDA